MPARGTDGSQEDLDKAGSSQNAVVSYNRRLLAPAIAGTRLNIHLRSEDFVRIVLRCKKAISFRDVRSGKDFSGQLENGHAALLLVSTE
jgi:hypothetical protein